MTMTEELKVGDRVQGKVTHKDPAIRGAIGVIVMHVKNYKRPWVVDVTRERMMMFLEDEQV